MTPLLHERCFNHLNREAAARCPECARHFYRECVSEHDDRVICAACLKRLAGRTVPERRTFSGILRLAGVALGLLTAWYCFYQFGQVFLNLPSSFHEGTVWQSGDSG
jgi:hypothetical protein